jgi:hypothetical protein
VSTAAFYGNFGQSAYAAAKAGMYALTRVAAHDMGRSGVTCNAVIPFAATRVTESIKPANEQQAAYKERAMQVPAVYVARFVSFLSTPEAKTISGQLFGVRGREVMLFSQPRPRLQPQGMSRASPPAFARSGPTTPIWSPILKHSAAIPYLITRGEHHGVSEVKTIEEFAR